MDPGRFKVYYSTARLVRRSNWLAVMQQDQEVRVSYLIDGHNLIPRVHGLDLSDPDDEMRLIEILQEFCLRSRKKVTVFFDQAPPGMSGSRNYGQVRAVFVRQGATADQAIVSRLEKLGRRATQYTVVSSDQWVVQNARSRRAQVLSAEQFAYLMRQAQDNNSPVEDPAKPQTALDDSEIEEWLNLFQRGEDSA